jgi:hypothetical protein
MPCTPSKVGNLTAIACSPKQRRRNCSVRHCGERAPFLCDYVAPGARKTCDKALCRHHAVNVGPDRDYCPHHPREQTEFKI